MCDHGPHRECQQAQHMELKFPKLEFFSKIHFQFIFVYGIREYSNFSLLHVAVQFSQHHLLKRLFSSLYTLASFVKDKLLIGVWVYFWTFQAVPLIYISGFMPTPCCFDDCSFVVQSEVREPDSSSSVFLSQYCFCSSGSSVSPYKFKNFLLQFCEKCHW